MSTTVRRNQQQGSQGAASGAAVATAGYPSRKQQQKSSRRFIMFVAAALTVLLIAAAAIIYSQQVAAGNSTDRAASEDTSSSSNLAAQIGGSESKKEALSPETSTPAAQHQHRRSQEGKPQQQQQQAPPYKHAPSRKPAEWIPLSDLLASAKAFVAGSVADQRVFVCGIDHLEARAQQRATTSPSYTSQGLEWGTFSERNVALRRVHRPAGEGGVSATVIPFERFNDDYCDCDDGSDEPGTSACSFVLDVMVPVKPDDAAILRRRSSVAPQDEVQTPLLSQPSQAATAFAGYCAGDPLTKLNPRQLNDGVCDCCECSDELVLTRRLQRELSKAQASGGSSSTGDESVAVASFGRRAALQGSKCSEVLKRRQLKREAEFTKILQGHQVLQQRAATGTKDFAPEFIANFTADSAKLDEEIAQYEGMVKALKASGAFQQQRKVDRETGQPIYDENIMRASQWHSAIQSKKMDRSNRQAVLESGVLGRQYEYFPLFGDCLNTTLGPKVLRGGNAEPNGEDMTFLVCPFRYIYQLSYEAVEEVEKTATAPAAQTTDESKEVEKKEKYTLVGYWAGFTTSYPLNMSSADIPLTGIVNSISQNRTMMHLYENGERCWNGPTRSARLVFVCDPVDRIIHFYENGMCRYEIVFGTPSACTAEELFRAKSP